VALTCFFLVIFFAAWFGLWAFVLSMINRGMIRNDGPF
jgi:hypothetical protein